MLIDGAVQDDPSDEAINHCLTHSRFSVNTLLPLLVGYQTKRNWKVEKNQGPALIFNETVNRDIDLSMFNSIYGVVSLKDYYTRESASIIGVFGVSDKPILVPVEISPSNVKVSSPFVIII